MPFDILMQGNSPGKVRELDSLGKRIRYKPGGIYRQFSSWIVTQMLMSIILPSRVLKLGKNVVAPTGVVKFPTDLVTVEDHRCKILAQQFDTALDTLSGSAADN